MIKLNNEQAKAAWADYKEFEGIHENKVYPDTRIEKAFKYAFALGVAAAAEQPEERPYIEPEQMELHLDKKTVKTSIKRRYGGRINRTFKQRKEAAEYLSAVLYSSGTTWKLQIIIEKMNKAGFYEWNENNSSGFVKDAMNFYPQIKRIGFGLYKYEE